MKFTVDSKLDAAKGNQASTIIAVPWHKWEMRVLNTKHWNNQEGEKCGAFIPWM